LRLLNVPFDSIFSRFPEGFSKNKCLLTHQGLNQSFPTGLEKFSLGAGVSFVLSRKRWRFENANASNDQKTGVQSAASAAGLPRSRPSPHALDEQFIVHFLL
jgi:hypothetical protein